LKNFDYQQISVLLEKVKKVVVTSHHNPDGDAIGSALALYHFLAPYVEHLVVTVPNDFPGFLKWLKGSDDIILYNQDSKKIKKALQEADLIFCLDYNALHRAGDMEKSLRQSKAEKFLIDHHPEPVLEDFDYWLTLTETSSTAELVYHFIQGTAPDKKLVTSLAECLFTGIMTDTGSFSYGCNHPGTFRVVADLIDAGVNAERVHRMVYDTYSENRLRLLGFAISEKMVVLPDIKMAYIYLSKEDLDRFGYQVGDTEGVVNYALSIEGVLVAVLLTERKDRIRVSFRSKGTFSVNRIAAEHFQGGGHRNAAGGDSYENMENTIARLRQVLQQYKGELDRSTI
jgi:phosphoesterase RecJ-like protein